MPDSNAHLWYAWLGVVISGLGGWSQLGWGRELDFQKPGQGAVLMICMCTKVLFEGTAPMHVLHRVCEARLVAI